MIKMEYLCSPQTTDSPGSTCKRLMRWITGGINTAVMCYRNKVWIVKGARLAKSIVHKYFECKLRNKPLQGQKMAPLHPSRIGPAPIFSSVAVDLFGPLEFRDMVKKRFSGKGWGSCLFVQPLPPFTLS